MTNTAATVTVVTGPTGHDIGPFTAWKAATDRIGDGLAVRVHPARNVWEPSAPTHLSPTPPGSCWQAPAVGAGSGEPVTQMPLHCLPSAWQDPQTNLGVAFAGAVDTGFNTDLFVLDRLGLAPHHRVTVQLGRPGRDGDGREMVPEPVELGNLAVQARDAVLRSSPASGSRYVLVEAGDGQTFLDALATLGLPPWDPAIDRLVLWLVLDVMHMVGTTFTAAEDRIRFTAEHAAAEAARQGGGRMAGALHAAMRIALVNVQAIVPGMAGLGEHETRVAEHLGGAPEQVVAQLGQALDTIEARTGVAVGAIHTGDIGMTTLGQWISLGLDPR